MFLIYIRMFQLFNLDTTLGKIVLIILIIIASHFHILFGIAIVLIAISSTEDIIEGMEDKESSKQSPQDTFRKNNCEGNFLMKDNEIVTPDIIKKSFPNLTFSDKECNPCDVDCKFEIIDSEERITNEDNLKAQDSNSIPIDREKNKKKKN